MIGPANVLARGLLAGVFVVGGINQIKGAHLLADKVEAAYAQPQEPEGLF